MKREGVMEREEGGEEESEWEGEKRKRERESMYVCSLPSWLF